jgi:hypothetical protein
VRQPLHCSSGMEVRLVLRVGTVVPSAQSLESLKSIRMESIVLTSRPFVVMKR